jgi:hypothetical protein
MTLFINKMNLSEDVSLLAFKTICNFVKDLSAEYGKNHKPLLLYNRLTTHTQISHDKAIKKHLSIFYDFSVSNREALLLQDSTKILCKKLVYSERVYIDMEYIFRIADKENSPVIWQHLLTISALIDPDGKAKDVLLKNKEDDKKEDDFLSDIISKVQQNVKPNSNPMEAFSSILQSGVATDLISNMQGNLKSGKLDMKKLLGSVKGLITNLENQEGAEPEMKKAMGMLNNLIGDGDSPPDLGAMMQGMMGLMGSMGGSEGMGGMASAMGAAMAGMSDPNAGGDKK